MDNLWEDLAKFTPSFQTGRQKFTQILFAYHEIFSGSQRGFSLLFFVDIELGKLDYYTIPNSYFRPAGPPKNTVHYITVVEMYDFPSLFAFTLLTDVHI